MHAIRICLSNKRAWSYSFYIVVVESRTGDSSRCDTRMNNEVIASFGSQRSFSSFTHYPISHAPQADVFETFTTDTVTLFPNPVSIRFGGNKIHLRTIEYMLMGKTAERPLAHRDVTFPTSFSRSRRSPIRSCWKRMTTEPTRICGRFASISVPAFRWS